MAKDKAWTSADDGVQWFRRFFERVGTSGDFLMGRTQREDRHAGWRCDIDFLRFAQGLPRRARGQVQRDARGLGMSTDDHSGEAGQRLRVPPHSIEAEQGVLGGLLLDNRAWDRAAEVLHEADFYRHEHRRIYTTIRALVSAGKPADVITVYEQMQRLGEAEDFGGLVYLNALAQSVPSAANIRRYAEIVRDRALQRTMIGGIDEALATLRAGDDVGAAADRLATLAADMQRRQLRQAPRAAGRGHGGERRPPVEDAVGRDSAGVEHWLCMARPSAERRTSARAALRARRASGGWQVVVREVDRPQPGGAGPAGAGAQSGDAQR